MKKFRLSLILFALVIAAASGCTLSAAGAPTADSSAIFTQAAENLIAHLTETAISKLTTPTPVGEQSGTAIPVEGGENSTPIPGESCDKAAFVADVTIPDGETFEAGDIFVKIWRLRNSGSCTWTSAYTVIFDSGDAMEGPASFQLTVDLVSPGEEIELSVTLTAPNDSGSYRGNWKLRNAGGQTFGTGSQGTSPFWVLINVGEKPQFTLEFSNIHECEDTNFIFFVVKNENEQPFESAEITLSRRADGEIFFGPLSRNDPFMSSTGECPPGADRIQPGKKGYLGGSIADTTSGENIRATINICFENNLQGSCTEKFIDISVP